LNAAGLVSLLPHETHRVELRLIRRLQESYPIKLLCEQFGVYRSSYKYWRSRRRVIDPDKVKLRALVNEKHELSIRAPR